MRGRSSSRGGKSAPQAARGQQYGYDRRDEAGQEQTPHQRPCRHVVVHPEHDGRHVADGRPGAAAVGRDDDHRGAEPTFVAVGNERTQQGDHDDRGGHVVQHGRHEKGDERQQPQEPSLAAHGDAARDDREASAGVDQPHDRHGPDQKDENLARRAQMSGQRVAQASVAAPQGEQRPQHAAHDERRGRLVDLQPVFEGDAEIAQREDRNHCRNHNLFSIVRFRRAAFAGARTPQPLQTPCDASAAGGGHFFDTRLHIPNFYVPLSRLRAND